MGRKKKMTPKAFERRVEVYFDGIRAETPMLRKVPRLEEGASGKLVPCLDEYGHERMQYEPVISASGKPVMRVEWIEPPSIIGLCLFLGIDRSTFFRWCNPPEDADEETKRFCNIATRARGRIEAYLTARTEDKAAARGAIANLEANFGWKRRKEIGLDEQTQRAVAAAGMTADEKLAVLREMGLTLPWQTEQEEEQTDDDE